jgi:hypothetical protein
MAMIAPSIAVVILGCLWFADRLLRRLRPPDENTRALYREYRRVLERDRAEWMFNLTHADQETRWLGKQETQKIDRELVKLLKEEIERL